MKNFTFKTLLIGMLFASPQSMASQTLGVDSICVNVAEAGKLTTVVEKLGKTNIKYLKITGKLSNNDLQALAVFPNIKSIYLEDAVYVVDSYEIEEVVSGGIIQYRDNFKLMQEELNAKKKAFEEEAASLPEMIKKRKLQEIADLEERVNTSIADCIKVTITLPKLPDLVNLFVFAKAEDLDGVKIPFSVSTPTFKVKNGVTYPSK